jgi:hypothetical protein
MIKADLLALLNQYTLLAVPLAIMTLGMLASEFDFRRYL